MACATLKPTANPPTRPGVPALTSLARSQETGRPVRVLRHITPSPAAQQFCYERLFRVVAYKYVTSKSGYLVWQLRLEP